MEKRRRDRLFAQPLGNISPFQFDDQVAAVFDDMIDRSVPGYRTIIDAIGLIACRVVQSGSFCYDLGCSLGAASLSVALAQKQHSCTIIAVDNAWPMLAGFQQKLRQQKIPLPVQLVCADIRDIAIQNASLVILNFTLQFVPPTDRLALLQKIYQGLLPGGALILSEKVALLEARQQSLFEALHYAFKKARGYSDLEISQKRSALEKVMIPESLPVHINRLTRAGFRSCEVWFQYFNFMSLVALK